MSKPNKPTTATIAQATWSGPLPPPAALEHFERIAPGTAQRIINHMIAEGEHRRSLEVAALDIDRQTVAGEHSITRRGQWLGFILGMAMIGGGVGLSAMGKDTSGLATILTGGAALLASMWFGRSQPKEESK